MIKYRSSMVPAVGLSCALAACSPSGGGGGSGSGAGGGGGYYSAGGGSNLGGSVSYGNGGQGISVIQNTFDAGNCGTAQYKGKLLPSNILFVQDRSGSMNCNLPPETQSAACEANPVAANPSDPTKWSVISSAIDNAIDQIALLPNTAIGLNFFSNDDTCGVSDTPSVPLQLLNATQVTALKNAYANVKPAGGTPIIGAVVTGYEYLHQVVQARGNRFVVLITDGSESCLPGTDAGHTTYADYPGTPADPVGDLFNKEVPNALAVNIRTFVIGVPGSETNRGFLSQLAFAGGTPSSPTCDHTNNPAPGNACHLDMSGSTESNLGSTLAAALQSITGTAALTCQFDVPTDASGTINTSLLNVNYISGSTKANTDLGRDDTCSGTNGWQFKDSTDTQIQLCPDVCNTVLHDQGAQVIVTEGCPQRIN